MKQLIDRLLNAVDASVNQNTAAVPSELLFTVSAQAVVTGSSTGALKLQGSNDIVTPLAPTPTHWTDITNATVTIGAAGTFMVQKTDICYQWIRAVYTKNNGSAGTITVIIKALGA